MCRKSVTINSYKDLLNYGRFDELGRFFLQPFKTYILNISIKLKSLFITGETEIQGSRKGITLSLTGSGISISTNSLKLLSLRNLRIISASKSSLFDLIGKTVKIICCEVKAKSLGRVTLNNLTLNNVTFNNFEMGFTIANLNNFTGRYIRGKNVFGPFIDISITKSLCNLNLKNIKFFENITGDFELVRVETKTDNVLYRSSNIQDLSLFDLRNVSIVVKGINSCKTILQPRDKLFTGFSYDGGGFIYQPYKFINNIALQTVNATSIYG